VNTRFAAAATHHYLSEQWRSNCSLHEVIEAQDEKRPHRTLAGHKPLIIDELGLVPLSRTGAGCRSS
jgi:hypothetical protein